MLYELLTLSVLLAATTATPGLWSAHVEEGPAPPVDKVPPFSQHAIRDPAALKWQIPTLIGSYLAFVLLTISFILTFGRRLRREALANTKGRPMELVKAPKRTFDPSPISPRNAPSWRTPAASRNPYNSTSRDQSHHEHVIQADHEQSKVMQRLYAAVLEEEEGEEEIRESAVSSPDDTVVPQATSENWVVHHRDSRESMDSHERPKSAGGAWWIHPSQLKSSTHHNLQHAGPLASSSTFSTMHSAKSSTTHLPSLPESPRPSHPPRLDSMPAHRLLTHSASRSSRNLRALRISTSTTPVLSPADNSAISRTTITPLSPLRSHPTSPLAQEPIDIDEQHVSSVRLVEQAEQTPKTALTYISESGVDTARTPYTPRTETMKSPRLSQAYLNRELPPLPLEAQKKSPRKGLLLSPRKAFFGRNKVDNSAQASSTSVATSSPVSRPLPFRTLSENAQGVPLPASPRLPPPDSGLAPLRSPVNTCLTVLTPRQDHFVRGNHPPVPATPYSAYMPFTPMTPVTPGLVRRAERKARQREEPRRAATSEDFVPDDAELWGHGYAD